MLITSIKKIDSEQSIAVERAENDGSVLINREGKRYQEQEKGRRREEVLPLWLFYDFGEIHGAAT